MTVTAKALIDAKYASSSDNTEYTVPNSTKTIIDKVTATNTDSGSQTVTFYLVPSGSSAGGSNTIMKATSIAAGATRDFTEMQNHVLSAGDKIAAVASVGSKVVIRASGREVS